MELEDKGNLFKLAEKKLIKDLHCGKIRDYSMLDIIDTAIVIRKAMNKTSQRNLYTGKEISKMWHQKHGRK